MYHDLNAHISKNMHKYVTWLAIQQLSFSLKRLQYHREPAGAVLRY